MDCQRHLKRDVYIRASTLDEGHSMRFFSCVLCEYHTKISGIVSWFRDTELQSKRLRQGRKMVTNASGERYFQISLVRIRRSINTHP